MDRYPTWVSLHHAPIPEAELFGNNVEVEIEKEVFPFVERRGLPFEEGVEAGQTLLAIEQEIGVAIARSATATYLRRLVRLPDEEVASRMASIQGLDEHPHLIPVPDITALELR